MAGGPLNVIELGERKPRLFPRSDLFDKSGFSLMLPETRELKAVELREVLEGVELRANGLIGYLPLTASVVLNLTPKFPIKNLWYMLSVADTDYDKILPVLRSYQTANAVPPHQLLARGFCHYLTVILTTGVARGYSLKAHRGYYRPKVNFGRTVGAYLSRGDELNVASDMFDFSANLVPNAILKSACLDFFRLIPRDEKWEADRKLIGQALNALGSVSAIQMRYGDQNLAEGLPAWLRASYQGALTVYSMLLGFNKIGFSYEAQGTKMPSFLFSLDKIFESYVRNTFKLALREEKIAVLDGNLTQNQGVLFTDNKKFPVQPDLIFRRKKIILGIAEVKYKEKLSEHDRYQVISHATAIGATKAVWISPASENAKPGLEYVGSIPSGIKFYHYQLDISSQNLADSSAQMVTAVSDLIR